MIAIIILAHFIGAILAYGRMYAEFWEIDKDYIRVIPPCKKGVDWEFLILSVVFGWLLFLVVTIISFEEKDGQIRNF